MKPMYLAATKNWLLKPFALLLGLIFTGLFTVISGFTDSQALALTIIIFTLIVRACLTPLMIKQQRSSRRMTRLQPKIEKIQAKYKNKKDPESTQRMNAEIQELYAQNKANPMSGCLPLLIQLPIIFALFEVLRNVPFYVNSIGDLYRSMATTVMGVSGYGDTVAELFPSVIKSIKNFDATSQTCMVDLLYHLSTSQWKTLIDTFNLSGNAEFISAYTKTLAYNTFGGGALTFNLSENAGWHLWGIIFPILAAFFTFLQSFVSQRANEKRQRMASSDGTITQQTASMKTMTYIFPIMTLFFTVSMPIGLDLYWIASSVFGMLTTWLIDKKIDHEEYLEALKHRDELIARRKEREESLSKLDKSTGGRLGTARRQQTKSELAGGRSYYHPASSESKHSPSSQAATAVKEISDQEETMSPENPVKPESDQEE